MRNIVKSKLEIEFPRLLSADEIAYISDCWIAFIINELEFSPSQAMIMFDEVSDEVA